ncbi:MAG: hypothetical protein QNJ97_24835 [Myxococcota bacterium]|nr:hypothetical protein [Myxococcota bacterium]
MNSHNLPKILPALVFCLAVCTTASLSAGEIIVDYPGSIFRAADDGNFYKIAYSATKMDVEGFIPPVNGMDFYNYIGSLSANSCYLEPGVSQVFIAPIERHWNSNISDIVSVSVQIQIEDTLTNSQTVWCQLEEISPPNISRNSDDDETETTGEGPITLAMSIDISEDDSRIIVRCDVPFDEMSS